MRRLETATYLRLALCAPISLLSNRLDRNKFGGWTENMACLPVRALAVLNSANTIDVSGRPLF